MTCDSDVLILSSRSNALDYAGWMLRLVDLRTEHLAHELQRLVLVTVRDGTLPRYMPSSVVSDSPGSLQLTSPDSIQKITAFYDNALTTGGWTIVSNSKTAYSTNITAKKGSTGTTLSISTTGSGCYISLVTYGV